MSKAISATNEQPDIESSTHDYAGRFSGAVGAWFLGVQSGILSELLGSSGGRTVLDVGGGHGQNVSTALTAGHKLTIVGSTAECDVLVRHYLDGGQVIFRQGDLLALPFPDRSWPICISFRMLPHLRDWQRHIAELCRIAEDEVIIDYPAKLSVNCVADLLFGFKKQVEKNTRPYNLFSHRRVEQEFAKHGFVLARGRPQYFFPMALHRMMRSTQLSSALEAVARTMGLTGWFGSPVIAQFVRCAGRDGIATGQH